MKINSSDFKKKYEKDVKTSAVDIIDNWSFSEQVVRDIRTISADFLMENNLSGFELARVYDDGTAFVLHSDPHVAKHVISNEVHLIAHMPNEELDSKFWYIPSEAGKYQQLIKDIKSISGSGSFVDLIYRYKGYVEMFCFFSTIAQADASTHFLNSKEKMEIFSNDFSYRARELIHRADQNRFKPKETMLPNFKGLEPGKPRPLFVDLGLYFQQIEAGLVRMKADPYTIFTPREMDCLQHLMLGKTIQETCRDLNLSKRTVEHYLESVREKLFCNRKSEIVRKFIQLNSKIKVT